MEVEEEKHQEDQDKERLTVLLVVRDEENHQDALVKLFAFEMKNVPGTCVVWEGDEILVNEQIAFLVETVSSTAAPLRASGCDGVVFLSGSDPKKDAQAFQKYIKDLRPLFFGSCAVVVSNSAVFPPTLKEAFGEQLPRFGFRPEELTWLLQFVGQTAGKKQGEKRIQNNSKASKQPLQRKQEQEHKEPLEQRITLAYDSLVSVRNRLQELAEKKNDFDRLTLLAQRQVKCAQKFTVQGNLPDAVDSLQVQVLPSAAVGVLVKEEDEKDKTFLAGYAFSPCTLLLWAPRSVVYCNEYASLCRDEEVWKQKERRLESDLDALLDYGAGDQDQTGVGKETAVLWTRYINSDEDGLGSTTKTKSEAETKRETKTKTKRETETETPSLNFADQNLEDLFALIRKTSKINPALEHFLWQLSTILRSLSGFNHEWTALISAIGWHPHRGGEEEYAERVTQCVIPMMKIEAGLNPEEWIEQTNVQCHICLRSQRAARMVCHKLHPLCISCFVKGPRLCLQCAAFPKILQTFRKFHPKEPEQKQEQQHNVRRCNQAYHAMCSVLQMRHFYSVEVRTWWLQEMTQPELSLPFFEQSVWTSLAVWVRKVAARVLLCLSCDKKDKQRDSKERDSKEDLGKAPKEKRDMMANDFLTEYHSLTFMTQVLLENRVLDDGHRAHKGQGQKKKAVQNIPHPRAKEAIFQLRSALLLWSAPGSSSWSDIKSSLERKSQRMLPQLMWKQREESESKRDVTVCTMCQVRAISNKKKHKNKNRAEEHLAGLVWTLCDCCLAFTTKTMRPEARASPHMLLHDMCKYLRLD